MSTKRPNRKQRPMPSRTVTSPGGDQIEVFTDDDFNALADTGVSLKLSMLGSRLLVLKHLWTHGGYYNKSGETTRPFYEALVADGYDAQMTAISPLLTNPEMAPCIYRKVQGKRCYEIRLQALPEKYYAVMPQPEPEPVVEPEPVEQAARAFSDLVFGAEPASTDAAVDKILADAKAEIEPLSGSNGDLPRQGVDVLGQAAESYIASVEVPEPAVELQIANAVALSLLTQVVEIIQAGPGDVAAVARLTKAIEDGQARLAQVTEYNGKLRRQLADARELSSAMTLQRDGLLMRVRALEANLAKALNGDAVAYVNDRVNGEIAKVMRAAPTVKGG